MDAADEPTAGLVMLDRSRLRQLTKVLSGARWDTWLSRCDAEELLELTGALGGPGVLESIESIRSLDSVSAWCQLQAADIERRLTLVAGDDLDHRAGSQPTLDMASAYDGRQLALEFRDLLEDEDPPKPMEIERLMPELRANMRDSKYVGAFFMTLGGALSERVAPMVLEAQLNAAGFSGDPDQKVVIEKEALESAVDQLHPFNHALMFALAMVGSPGGVDETFVKDFTSGPTTKSGGPVDEKDLAERIREQLKSIQPELDAAGFTVAVVQPLAGEVAKTGSLADKAWPANSVAVLKQGGRVIGVVSFAMLLTQLDEGDGGDKAAVAAQLGLTAVATLVSGPIGWAATGALFIIFLCSNSGTDGRPGIDTKRYFDKGRPEGTNRQGGLNPYMDESGVPKENN